MGFIPRQHMVIGIDHGNSQVKTVHETFTSGITAHGTAKPSLPTDIILYDGNYFTISSRREPYKRDKTTDEKCFIMTLFALAKEIESSNQYSDGEMEVYLAVGLPPEHISKQKAAFIKYFNDHGEVWSFKFNDKPYTIRIADVFVFPQAYSAVAIRASKFKSYSSTYIIDIGGYTVDTLLLTEGRPDLQYCNSFELGIISMNNQIISRVNSELSYKIDDNHVTDALMEKPTALDQEVIDFIKQSANAHTLNILEKLREVSVDLRVNPSIFIGGGSLILKDMILKSGFVNEKFVEFVPEVSANALGYTALATGMLRKKQ